MLELLTWIARSRRTYGETMQAWRSTCPRLTVWEDALIEGLVQVENGKPQDQCEVSLTPRGLAMLEAKRNSRLNPTGFWPRRIL